MKRHSPYQDRKSLEIAMTPMIDVVFLLLVFFIWTASFQIVEYSLPSSLAPLVGTGQATEPQLEMEDFDQVVVRIVQDGDQQIWMINETARSNLTEVQETLALLIRIRSDAPLVIDPDEGVSVGDVIDVYDLARQLNFQEIQFAVAEDA
ncbi:MAG: ExbD/TolR family protein [Pirellulales bacterium]|jgi:biopolymer transport protein ExbD